MNSMLFAILLLLALLVTQDILYFISGPNVDLKRHKDLTEIDIYVTEVLECSTSLIIPTYRLYQIFINNIFVQ